MRDSQNEIRAPYPPWLKAMENASIAEARTRSFLLDRFWILERSVDLDGADFIVQRRLTSKTLLDKDPPSLGVVQTKFFASEKTIQYIHREYIVGPDGTALGEFFLFCHTGFESDAKSFFLTAQQVMDAFEVTPKTHSQPGQFALQGKNIIRERAFEIITPELVLDRMEHALQQADFVKNRRFISWVLPVERYSPDDIEQIYTEPLDNWYADIPQAFFDLKNRADRAFWKLEDALSVLEIILRSNDPEKALKEAEYFDSEFTGYVLFHDKLFDQDLLSVVRRHKARVTRLKESGLQDAFFAVESWLIKKVCADLRSQQQIEKDEVYVVDVSYDPENFSNLSFKSCVIAISSLFSQPKKGEHWLFKDAPDCAGILMSSPGYVQVYWIISRTIPASKPEHNESYCWIDEVRKVIWRPTRYLMEEIYRFRFGEDE